MNPHEAPSQTPTERTESNQAHNVLKAFFKALRRGIDDAESFKKASNLFPLEEMTEEEIAEFDEVFGLTEFILNDLRAGNIVVADFEEITDPLLEGSIALLQNSDHEQQLSPRAIVNRGQTPKFRVFTPEPNKKEHRVPVYPFDPHAYGMKIYYRPNFHMRGQGRQFTGDPLYNAFIGLDFIITDRHGRLVVEDVWKSFPGKGRVGSINGQGDFVPLLGEEPVFHPYGAIDISLWFNTDITQENENRLKIQRDESYILKMKAELHDPNEIDSIVIPDNPKVALFFKILNQYVKNNEIGTGRAQMPNLEIS